MRMLRRVVVTFWRKDGVKAREGGSNLLQVKAVPGE